MTIQRNLLLSSLLIAGTYAYSMENNKGIFLTKSEAEGIKTVVLLHVDAKMNGTFYTIPTEYMNTIATHRPINAAFNALRSSEKSEEHFELFNKAVDRYVEKDLKDNQ